MKLRDPDTPCISIFTEYVMSWTSLFSNLMLWGLQFPTSQLNLKWFSERGSNPRPLSWYWNFSLVIGLVIVRLVSDFWIQSGRKMTGRYWVLSALTKSVLWHLKKWPLVSSAFSISNVTSAAVPFVTGISYLISIVAGDWNSITALNTLGRTVMLIS